MTDKNTFAFDKSVRTYDADGRLKIEVSHISKAMVCPYYGREIPSYDELGLVRDQIYYLLRDADELRKSVDSFNNLPLLIEHAPVSAEDSRREIVVGTTGSDAVFNHPYLDVSIAIWDKEAIDGVEDRSRTELSSAYRYRADMTQGEFEGMKYDGVMRDIIGNHVALVERGRAGHDVVVGDSDPFNIIEVPTMKKTKRELLAEKLAADAALTPEQIAFAMDALKASGIALDAEEDEKVAEDTDEEDEPKAEDSDDEEDEKDEKKAMDAASVQLAIDSAVSVASKKIKADMEALYKAREVVQPLVGKVALDSAESVYKFALDHFKVDTKGVHPSAFGAMVKMLDVEKPTKSPIALDSATRKSVADRFPGLNRFGA